MKIFILSDANSSHTLKWVNSLAESGLTIALYSLQKPQSDIQYHPKVILYASNHIISKHEGALSKISYLFNVLKIKRLLAEFNPDILHAHYASSYGLLGALTGFDKFIVSVWGSDVFSFPKQNIFNKWVVKYVFYKAKKILSTSHIMATETKIYTSKPVEITPFGIDLNIFKPMEVVSPFSSDDIVIGTVKTLEEKYGIEYLIKAFKIINDKYPDSNIKLLIVGGGSLENYLKKLVEDLDLGQRTIFVGKVPYHEVPKYHNMLSISVSVSVSSSESFGVAIIEASACEIPVIVSNIGGLPEVVNDGVTGFIVPPRDPMSTSRAIEKMILNQDMMKRMGKSGREWVREKYNWQENVNQMIHIYNNITKK